jgi:hypothetical protein
VCFWTHDTHFYQVISKCLLWPNLRSPKSWNGDTEVDNTTNSAIVPRQRKYYYVVFWGGHCILILHAILWLKQKWKLQVVNKNESSPALRPGLLQSYIWQRWHIMAPVILHSMTQARCCLYVNYWIINTVQYCITYCYIVTESIGKAMRIDRMDGSDIWTTKAEILQND